MVNEPFINHDESGGMMAIEQLHTYTYIYIHLYKFHYEAL